jgi:hypothetical protein
MLKWSTNIVKAQTSKYLNGSQGSGAQVKKIIVFISFNIRYFLAYKTWISSPKVDLKVMEILYYKNEFLITPS